MEHSFVSAIKISFLTKGWDPLFKQLSNVLFSGIWGIICPNYTILLSLTQGVTEELQIQDMAIAADLFAGMMECKLMPEKWVVWLDIGAC